MPSWRENVDPLIKEHLEAQIRETTKHQSTYLQSKNPQGSQLWVAIANLSKQILSLSLRVKYMEKVLKDTLERIEQQKTEAQPQEPISFVLDSKPLLNENDSFSGPEIDSEGHIKVKEGEQRKDGYLYFVKGDDLEVYKAKMARGGRKKKKKKSSVKIKKVKKGKRGRPRKK